MNSGTGNARKNGMVLVCVCARDDVEGEADMPGYLRRRLADGNSEHA
jgi:hypothetical protein